MKNIFLTFLVFALVSCKQAEELDKSEQAVGLDSEEIFARFQTVLMADDYSLLANELDPGVLESFRRQLEFSVELPREGSWFTGSMDRWPTKEELAKLDDRAFFVTYMKGESTVIGNPFLQEFRDAKVVAMTVGKNGFHHFVVQADETVARPTIFSFGKADGKWLLIDPCIVNELANRLRAEGKRILGG